jgi:F-type H+-transporting ATPase subunit c
VNRRLAFLLLALVALLLAMPVFAQGPAGGAPAPTSNQQWIIITSGFAMAFASGICGLAQGKAAAAAAEGMARNPAAVVAISRALIISLAFIESLALYTLVIVFLKVSAT